MPGPEQPADLPLRLPAAQSVGDCVSQAHPPSQCFLSSFIFSTTIIKVLCGGVCVCVEVRWCSKVRVFLSMVCGWCNVCACKECGVYACVRVFHGVLSTKVVSTRLAIGSQFFGGAHQMVFTDVCVHAQRNTTKMSGHHLVDTTKLVHKTNSWTPPSEREPHQWTPHLSTPPWENPHLQTLLKMTSLLVLSYNSCCPSVRPTIFRSFFPKSCQFWCSLTLSPRMSDDLSLCDLRAFLPPVFCPWCVNDRWQ